MTPLQQAHAAVELLIDALHATAQASPEAEYAAHEAFAAVRLLGFDTRHSQDGKPAKTWVRAVTPVVQPGLFP